MRGAAVHKHAWQQALAPVVSMAAIAAGHASRAYTWKADRLACASATGLKLSSRIPDAPDVACNSRTSPPAAAWLCCAGARPDALASSSVARSAVLVSGLMQCQAHAPSSACITTCAGTQSDNHTTCLSLMAGAFRSWLVCAHRVSRVGAVGKAARRCSSCMRQTGAPVRNASLFLCSSQACFTRHEA
jgi:hypothetical protein